MDDCKNLNIEATASKKKREAYTAAKKKVPEMSVKTDRLHIGAELSIKPSIAAIKLDADLSDWEGTPVRELLTEEERRQYDKGEIEFDSIKLSGGVTLSNPASNRKEGKASNKTVNEDELLRTPPDLDSQDEMDRDELPMMMMR
ncbi:hypothetical protein Aduo_006368 [Ancylostoma duodenale]